MVQVIICSSGSGVLKWHGGCELYKCDAQVCDSAALSQTTTHALREIELWFRGTSSFVVEVELPSETATALR